MEVEGGADAAVWKGLTARHEKCTQHVTRRSSLTAKTLFVELQDWIIYDEKATRDTREKDRGMVETRATEETREKTTEEGIKRKKEINFIVNKKTSTRLTEGKGIKSKYVW